MLREMGLSFLLNSVIFVFFSSCNATFRLDNRIGDRFKELKEEFYAELRFELQDQLHGVFEQYLGKISASDKGKEVMNGSPPGFSPKDLLLPPQSGDSGSQHSVRLVMLSLEGRALDWHHFYAQKQGGFYMLELKSYAQGFKDSNLHADVGQYLQFLKPTTLMEGFLTARQVEAILSGSSKQGLLTGWGPNARNTTPSTLNITLPLALNSNAHKVAWSSVVFTRYIGVF
ncbi:hypothetical protein J1N35_028644 [Gossypium stocksii]|uniref:Uncharacterized protein n=1 Tax=Gossypium stocksii TaxID=47602 RepID=A0A9D3UWP3_9ROSI|nr:hypothetical protein J1N35_028644 [Gossypium stocksii]